MRWTYALCSLLLLSSAAQAQPTKQECKAAVGQVRDLAKQLDLKADTAGRALMNQIAAWSDAQNDATITKMVGDIERVIGLVSDCEKAGLGSKVLPAKPLSKKLKTAVLPWLRNATAVDACQGLINQAVRKKADDLDGAITDLERSVVECDDDVWLMAAHRNLAAMYYERGSPDGQDYDKARRQIRAALALGQGQSDADRKPLVSLLAGPTVQVGKALMDQGRYEEAGRHWAAYIEIFGTTGFDIVIGRERVAAGAGMLRNLRDARYQMTLACLEQGDAECAAGVILPAVKDYQDDMRTIRDLTGQLFEQAAGTEGAAGRALYGLAFELLTSWREIDPDSFQIRKILEDRLISLDKVERLALLQTTEQCWIPMQAAAILKQEDRAYLEELEMAAACGEGSAQAGEMLAGFYLQMALDKLDRVEAVAGSVAEKRRMFNEVERELLPKIQDPAGVEELRARLAEERKRLQQELARAEQHKGAMYEGCTDLLATIQWNFKQENEYETQQAEFKRDCCRQLRPNANAWVSWMKSETPLEDPGIEDKRKLMLRYCK